MLQPRIPFRWGPQPCQLLRPLLRHYATPTKAAALRAKRAKDAEPKIHYTTGKLVTEVDGGRLPPTQWRSGKTHSSRFWRRPVHTHLWKGGPWKPLTIPKKGMSRGGRNNTGRVTVRHRGGGHKRRIRLVDFYRKDSGKQLVKRIEYDPNRTAHIALLEHQKTGKLSYIIASDGLRAGDVVESFRKGIPQDMIDSMGGSIDPGVLAAKISFSGNCLPARLVPLGSQVFNVGIYNNGRAMLCRSSGTFALVQSREERDDKVISVTVKLQSGEVRLIHPDACTTMGVASNNNYNLRTFGKAGRKRWLGIRPTVRGLAMNAADHPHGGGRGKSKGNVIPVSPWGTQAKSGYKTRPKKKINRMLVEPRVRNQGKRRTNK